MILFIPITNRLSIQALSEPCSRQFGKVPRATIPVSILSVPRFLILSQTRRAQLNTVVQISRPPFSVPLIIV